MKIARLIIYIFSAVLIYSCGEDRTYEYEEKVKVDKWIEETMKEHYLWYDQMPELKFNDYFAIPQDFLQKIVFKGDETEGKDNFSYVEVNDSSFNTIHNFTQDQSTYGFDFELISDPTGTTAHKSARVLFVLPNSPAYEAGLKRGNWIYNVDGVRITNDNFGLLMRGGVKTFTLRDLTEVNGELAWSNERNIKISPSRIVENNPFYVDTTYNIAGKKIAYLVYNKFSAGPKDESTDTQYSNQMKQIFSKFKSEAANDFILDLRYNPGGRLSCGEELASMLAPSNALGKTFVTLQYNDKSNPEKVSYNFDSNLSSYNLNLKKIYIITSSFTASTSEAVINSLKPYMGSDNVITIGETTVGENVALQAFNNDTLKITLWPVVAYVLNADNSGENSNGINPTYPVNERTYYGPLLPLGDTNELLLKNTISLITSGEMPSFTKNRQNNSKISKQATSLTLRNHIGSKVK